MFTLPTPKRCCASLPTLYVRATQAELAGTSASFTRTRLSCYPLVKSQREKVRSKAQVLQTGSAHNPLTKKQQFSAAARRPTSVHSDIPAPEITSASIEELALAGRRSSTFGSVFAKHKSFKACKRASLSTKEFKSSASAAGIRCGRHDMSYSTGTVLDSVKGTKLVPNVVPPSQPCLPPGSSCQQFASSTPKCDTSQPCSSS